MRNSEIVKEYRSRIEDFKEIYQEDVKLPIGRIDNYEEAYRRELEIVSNLEFKEYQILLNYVEEDIANFVSDKRELGFTPNASRLTLGLLKGKFISKAPVEDNDENIKILANSIYREDPWSQAQPKNDDELEMHREWWNIELWKHQAIKDYFYKKERHHSFEKLWNEIRDRDKETIETVARNFNKDGRSNYKFEEIKVYLAICIARPELSSAEKRRDYSLRFLSKEAAERLEKARPNVYGSSWEKKLRQEFHAQE